MLEYNNWGVDMVEEDILATMELEGARAVLEECSGVKDITGVMREELGVCVVWVVEVELTGVYNKSSRMIPLGLTRDG